MTRHLPDIFTIAEGLMQMDNATWARHSNPKSVYSRFSTLPLITFAIWSRIWLGWVCVIPLALALLWTWWNPRAFAAPDHTDNWASRGTFGERVFLNRANVPVPAHHEKWVRILTWVSALGMVPLLYGLWAFDISATLLGMMLIIGGKVWFVDRMVWLYQDMKDSNPTYASWLR